MEAENKQGTEVGCGEDEQPQGPTLAPVTPPPESDDEIFYWSESPSKSPCSVAFASDEEMAEPGQSKKSCSSLEPVLPPPDSESEAFYWPEESTDFSSSPVPSVSDDEMSELDQPNETEVPNLKDGRIKRIRHQQKLYPTGVSFEDVKREVSDFILKSDHPLDISDFKEEYSRHGGWANLLLYCSKHGLGFGTYLEMIKEFSKTEGFQVVKATRQDCEDSPKFWTFAVNPNNWLHWKYLFKKGYIRAKGKHRVIAQAQASAPTGTSIPNNHKNSSCLENSSCAFVSEMEKENANKGWTTSELAEMMSMVGKSTEWKEPQAKRQRLENAGDRDKARRILEGVRPRSYIQTFLLGNCIPFQKGLCDTKICPYRHRCGICASTFHGSSTCKGVP